LQIKLQADAHILCYYDHAQEQILIDGCHVSDNGLSKSIEESNSKGESIKNTFTYEVISDYLECSLPIKLVEDMSGFEHKLCNASSDIKSILSIPLIFDRRVFAVLHFISYERYRFDEVDKRFLLKHSSAVSKEYMECRSNRHTEKMVSLLEGLIDKILAKDRVGVLEFISMASEFEAEMIIDELMLYLKEILLQGSHKLTPMIIERFFRVLADSKTLLSIGSDGEFVLSLTLFKMMESLQIQDIDGMRRTLKKELKGVEIAPPPISKPTEKSSTEITESIPFEDLSEIEPITPPKPIKKEKPIDQGAKQFKSLVDKIYDRNYELGECFEASITYSSFEKNRLTWKSTASGENKTLLKNNWGLIRMFVQEVFGYETKIKNISKESP